MIRVGLLPYATLDRPNGVNRYVRALLAELPETDLASAPHPPRNAGHRTPRRPGRLPSLRRRRGRSGTPLDAYDVVHVPYERIDPRVSLRDRTVVATVMGLGGLTGANPTPGAHRLDTVFVDAMQRLDDVTFITPSEATRQVVCVSDAVVVTGALSDAELADAYRGATALCVPSRYEGFGLPVLEAMACGTPVIVSSSPALVEVAGVAAVVVDTSCGPSALAEAIGQVTSSPTARDELRARGLARAATFTWADCARRHLEQYRLAIDDAAVRDAGYPPPAR